MFAGFILVSEPVKSQQRFVQELKMRCGQYKIDFIEADIRQSMDQILLPYLVKRGKMR